MVEEEAKREGGAAMTTEPVATIPGSCYFDASWQKGAMEVALEEARKAALKGDVPVGAALYLDGEMIASAHNRREELCNPLAHAECLALAEAAGRLGGWRLTGSVLVVTLEPCPMCMGAMLQARVGLLIYGADDPRAGAAGTLYDLACDPRLNHSIRVVRGVLREESASLLKGFFEQRRP